MFAGKKQKFYEKEDVHHRALQWTIFVIAESEQILTDDGTK